ncbi:MAG TPA: sigma-70 family RNA polymerase sigma factor [Phaeodactylibacter sp.]|nr:sigma-70 family RNA polymerase sigma factor [Phaeodactylibacter sp.]
MKDEDIIKGCLRKEKRFQYLLVAKYSAMLLTVSRSYTPAHIGAEDVLQDAFIKIFNKLHQYDSNRGSFFGWMRKIVINTALKKLSKMSYTHERTTEHLEDIQLHPSIYQQLDAEDIIRLIRQVPEGYRQVFNLYVVDGYSHKEIAELLNISEGTSRSNLFKAKRILRKLLTSQKDYESWARIS